MYLLQVQYDLNNGSSLVFYIAQKSALYTNNYRWFWFYHKNMGNQWNVKNL